MCAHHCQFDGVYRQGEPAVTPAEGTDPFKLAVALLKDTTALDHRIKVSSAVKHTCMTAPCRRPRDTHLPITPPEQLSS